MSMSDPIADMLTRIRNAQMVGDDEVAVPASKLKSAIAEVLQREGYVESCALEEKDGRQKLVFKLKYHEEKPVISRIKRVSRPGLRIYRGADELPKVLNGMGIAVVSTPEGVMTDREARAKHQGGEILCTVE